MYLFGNNHKKAPTMISLNTIRGNIECSPAQTVYGRTVYVPTNPSIALVISHELRMTTPQQVRSALKKSGMPYGVAKAHGVWYVFGGESHGWYSSSLNVPSFSFISADAWVEEIRAMHLQFGTKSLD